MYILYLVVANPETRITESDSGALETLRAYLISIKSHPGGPPEHSSTSSLTVSLQSTSILYTPQSCQSQEISVLVRTTPPSSLPPPAPPSTPHPATALLWTVRFQSMLSPWSHLPQKISRSCSWRTSTRPAVKSSPSKATRSNSWSLPSQKISSLRRFGGSHANYLSLGDSRG